MIRLTFFQIIRTEEEKIQELKAKYLKHRQILISNYEMSEAEVKKLDDIYHDTVQKVLRV